MDRPLKLFLTKSIVVLCLIHVAYFIYGYYKFVGIKNINIFTEFYRFKFYDDVSISHFFISGLFLLFFLVFLLRNHSEKKHTASDILKIGAVLLIISLLSFTFFISYSLGMNAKLKHELPEKDFNKDKTLLNILNPFLYNYTSYSSEKLFNPENILYPDPYPVVAQKDSIFYDPDNKDNYYTETAYYSIDTIKIPSSDYKKLSSKMVSGMDILGLEPKELNKRIISKKVIGDSTEVLFKGIEVLPEQDEDICIFLENKNLFIPINNIPEGRQQYQSAVARYKLLYKYSQDSMLHSFQKLDALLKKYSIETQMVPENLKQDAFYYRDNTQEPLNAIRNTFDRNTLKERFKILDRLFYKPNYLHSSIQVIFISVVLGVWLILFLLYLIWNSLKNRKPSVIAGK